MGDTPGRRLAEFRKSLSVSQRVFAESIGVSAGRIGSLETDAANLSRSILSKISEVYGISSDWLLNGRGAMVADDGAHPIPVRKIDQLMLMVCAGAVKEEYAKAGVSPDSDTLLTDSTWAYNEVMQRMTDPTDGDELEAVIPQVRLLFRRKLTAKT
jgi:transcriptional regulator with XRE-family HTH domain